MADLNIGNSSASVVVNAKHNGSVIPQIDNTYDLGTSELRWKNIYGNLKGNADTATHFENNSFRTLRDFTNGTLITTDLSGGTTNSSIPFYVEIVGNGYGNGLVSAYCQGYVYHLGDGYSQYINCDAYSVGKSFTNTIYAFSNSNGKLCFWFANMAYWQGFDIKVYDTSENINTKKLINHVVSVTNVTLPTTRSWETQIAVRKFIDSGIIDSKYVKKSGDTMTGSLTTPNLFVVNDSSNSGYDALAYFRSYSNNDWAMIIDKNNAYDCGLDIRASGSNALRVNGSSRFKNSATFGADVAPSYTVDVRGKTRSTDRIYANEWVQFDNYTGLYSPNNNAHFYPNNSTTYGQWKILGSKGGYSGIQLGDTTGYMTLMDDGVNKGLYQENQGKWLFYYNASNKRVGIRTSSLSGYAVTCDGDFYCSNGWLRTTGTSGWLSESYGGGWYMTDSTYIRNYGSKTTRLDNLCLGADNNSYRLYVNGTSLFNGNVNLTASHGIIFTSTAGGTNTSTPTGLTYGRLQGTSSFSINADTDGSKTEYLILTSGRGMSNSISDGLAIGYDSITWRGNNLWGKYLMKKTTIDASSLNQNTWYPVSIYVPPNYNVRIEIEVALDSGTTPSWSTHSSGFSVRKIWETNGSGWGTIPVTRNIYVSTYSFASVDPVRGLDQNTMASVEIVYVRGGGKYFFRTSPEAGTPTLNPSGYSWSGGGNYSYSAPITTTAPAVISAYADITVPRANNATKLATARTIRTNLASTSAASFDGSANITPGVTGTLPIANGGTGATTASTARNNLGAQSKVLYGSSAPSDSTGSNGDMYIALESGDFKKDIVNLIYPVGSIYISMNSTNPSTLFGGTWEAFGQGRVLIGAGTGNDGSTSLSFTAGGTGGEYKHKLSTSEMPSHTHTQNAHTHTVGAHSHGLNSHTHSYTKATGVAGHTLTVSEIPAHSHLQYVSANSGGWAVRNDYDSDAHGLPYSQGINTGDAGGGGSHSHGLNTSSANTGAASGSTANSSAFNSGSTAATNKNTGGGSSHNNIQPYIVVYMWKRTA